ncbi:hypothetical protein WOLCODRAFT_95637 [Wolfiporia cocos MD-104 SS10]|uniref:Nucleoside triphosphate hydrolase protein n=1 Tax=Wolfiporia cocos (strain MD-104) TaxID=742152 RepID=A0A2H3J652_WOLCO|nr:hypothetical protein WOLCODRAFT_95637 [Wolfiporia cocos MD-104 SS10]
MAEIFGDLPSPNSQAQNLTEAIPGMRSLLYPYQARSVSAMISREHLSPSRVPDPLYIPVVGIDGSTFYFQPANMELFHEPPMIETVRDGMLCEELGTGKTIMMLGLILSTLDELPAPEDSDRNFRPVMTPLAFRHFNTANCVAARDRFHIGNGRKQSRLQQSSSQKIPSLVELLLDYCRCHPENLQLRQHQESLEQRRLWTPLMLNNPFYHHYELDPDMIPVQRARSRRRETELRPRTILLSCGTLVIVPKNLFHQWRGEVMKHCLDQIRVLEIQTGSKLPEASVLASQYDIVLMTYDRFSQEAAHRDISELYSWFYCSCPGYNGTRVPYCTCEASRTKPNVSPLLQIRWKRLVIDEGHVSADRTTNLTALTKALSVERKWIVTGTPTTNLLGLNFGQGSELQYPETSEPDESADQVEEQERVELGLVAREWTTDDRDDLRKLGAMITHFLAVPRFANDQRAINKLVIEPLMEHPCPRPGAIKVLEQIMSMIMIRHRIEDIENDVLLPLLKHDTILLDLDPIAVKSYNMMQAGIIINAIDSERVDQDYLFHPRNVGSLQQLVSNMSQAMFWHVDDEKLFNVDEIHSHAEDHLRRAHERNASQQDIGLLQQAITHVKDTVNDAVWRVMQSHVHVFYQVRHVQPEISSAWSILPMDSSLLPFALFTSDQLQMLKSYVMIQPLSPIQHLAQVGEDIRREERRRIALIHFELQQKRSSRTKDLSRADLKERDTIRKLVTPERREELQREFTAAQAALQAHFQKPEDEHTKSDGISVPSKHAEASGSSRLLGLSPVAGIRIGNSTSTKLDYILNEVLQHASTVKFLIFSASPLTLSHVADGLALIGTKYLQFTTKVKPKQREQLITTFETSELYRVLLMELKHGARGLNLVTASRVIFCEPVWQADVETQAIKRVHRIGQTRPVIVKTLAIRSTAEEFMVQRREVIKDRGGKQQNFTDDRRIRDFIANPTFLSKSNSERTQLDIPLFNIEPSDAGAAPSRVPSIHKRSTADTENLDVDYTTSNRQSNAADEASPKKKRRIARFAD